MKRYTRDEVLRLSGTHEEELRDYEGRGLLVPYRTWSLFHRRKEYYTEGQLDVLKWLTKTRRRVQSRER